MKKTVISAIIAATALTSVPAFGDPPPWAPAHGRRAHERYESYERGGDYQRNYNRTDNGIAYWRGDDGRYYCRRSNGTTGLVIGAIGGAALGSAIGGDTLGTLLGAGAGALAGRSIDRSRITCR